MPHVIVKMISGRTDEQKRRLAAAVTEALVQSLGASTDSISVAIEDVPKDDWTTAVYDPDIAAKPETIWKEPGYGRG